MRLEGGFFFFNDTATTEIYTLSLHDALPIFHQWSRIPGSKPTSMVHDAWSISRSRRCGHELSASDLSSFRRKIVQPDSARHRPKPREFKLVAGVGFEPTTFKL